MGPPIAYTLFVYKQFQTSGVYRPSKYFVFGVMQGPMRATTLMFSSYHSGIRPMPAKVYVVPWEWPIMVALAPLFRALISFTIAGTSYTP